MALRLAKQLGTISRGLSRRSLSSTCAQEKAVNAWNEWDPLEEVIVGRAEGQRVPFLSPDLKAKCDQNAWKWIEENAGKSHTPEIVKKASGQIEELCRVLQGEGVRIKRPEPIAWDKLGTFRTPSVEDGGTMNACPRDGFMVVGDEIIESAMSWRSRMFESHAYKKLFTDYFKRGAKWTCAPYPAMGDDLYKQDYPFDDHEARVKLMTEGENILTEAEIAFDAADALRFGKDIFLCLTQTTNRSGHEWLKRHLAPKDIRVHSLIFNETHAVHADATFIPLKPGVLIVSPIRHCIKINDVPTNKWDWFTDRGWKVYEVPAPAYLQDTHYVSKWIHMNVLSIDEERVLMQKGEEPLKQLFVKLGMKPIEVDLQHCNGLGGAFHCWTLDVKRKGKLQDYFS
ncbi:hypothetical protein CAPTEDRAFT_108300 [Capitella teleta]|uniref:Glycine amidinotransferase n=1 Tax=Capitella teleta TaxID=283909 RepID=R7U1V1_CAPTE|nr:hypothetical protein CAPTEDRAFT_108300 [Capitella teleta]|eukprot:ELT97160.1 hypothetical protein CAPTEDRAFT_108300 [Capitella teleta]